MSRKIQVVVSNQIAEEIDTAMIKEKYSDMAEFVRQCIRTYLKGLETPPTCSTAQPAMEADTT